MTAAEEVPTIPEAILAYERAVAQAGAGRWTAAAASARQAMAMFEAEDGPDSSCLANAANLMAHIAESQADYSAAESCARRAWSIMERLDDRCRGPEATSIRFHALSGIGTALRCAGRYEEAEPWLQQALEIAGDDVVLLLDAWNNLGSLYKYSGRADEAEHYYRLAMCPADPATRHPCDTAQIEVAVNLDNLAAMRQARGDLLQAETLYRSALAMKENLFGLDHPDTALTALSLGSLLNDMGEQGEARRLILRALRAFETTLPYEHPRTVAARKLAAILGPPPALN